MQFQVPQFIEIEDKIIGPLTIRQFIYLATGAGISVMLYFAVETWVWLILSALLLGIAGAFAFVKVNGRPFYLMIFAGARFLWSPHTYVWQPDQPTLPKTASTMAPEASGFSLERILAGHSLKDAWRAMQTGTATKKSSVARLGSERYMIFRRPTGERRAVRRVDYR